MNCGAKLPEALATESEERKIVTVLFCDLVGFTALSDKADPEDVKATLRPYHARLVHEIERFGGTVEKFIGDAVMAVFGAPVAHEDDPERAVRCALRIIDGIEELNEAHPRLDLAIRLGINTGEAVVTVGGGREREGMVAGDVVNTASRLEKLAPVGGVVVGEATYRATKQLFEYQHLEPARVKGKSDLVPIWQAMAVRSRYGPGVVRRSGTSLVGREHELEVLKRNYTRASREGSVQLVTIMGEPGVGKSRLVREFFGFIDTLPEFVYWRQGRCLPYGEGITFWGLSEVVKAQAGILESDSLDEAAAKLEKAVEACVEDPSERGWLTSRLSPLIGLAPPDASGLAERAESFAAWRRFLEALAAVHPLVLVFEDIHWADEAMVEFLEQLVDWAHDVPMLVLTTARPELYERHTKWGGGKRNATTITLAPLTPEEMGRLIAALSPESDFPLQVQDVVRERAEGNPLYAEEFLAMMGDREVVSNEAASGAGAQTWDDLPFPGSIQSIIAARLDTLTAQQKSLLQDASVVGKIFWSGTLAAMSGLAEADVRDLLHQLTRKELVRPARSSSVRDEAEYSFWHILIRDVAYGQIPRATRSRKHRAAADWARLTAGERATDVAELVAYHYWQALELARAAGRTEEAAALEDPTRRFTVMAGDRTFGLDVARARAHFVRALGLLPQGHAERGRLLAKAGEAAARMGRFPEAKDAYEGAIEELSSQRDNVGAGDAMVKLSNLLWHRGETAASREILTRGIGLLEGDEPGPELANAYTESAAHMAVQGELGQSVQLFDRALAHMRTHGLHEQVPRALGFRGAARWELGDPGGLDDLREALDGAERLGLGRDAARIRSLLASTLWLMEGPEHALDVAMTGVELAERRGNVDMAMAMRAEMLGPLFDKGDWDQLLRIANEVIKWSGTNGEGYFAVVAECYKAHVLVFRGDVATAVTLTESFLPLARQIGDPQVLVAALAVAALCRRARDEFDASMAIIRELEELLASRATWYVTQYIVDIARVCASAQEIERVERLLEGQQVRAQRLALSVLAARAVIQESRGQSDAASETYRKAAEGWRAFGFDLEQGQATLGAGRTLLQQGRVEGVAALRGAREIFTRLQAEPLVTETDRWLARASVATT
jgi:class 3 adenylate cyclase/tetratricopeptide (TPR) repeat protein